MVSFLDAKQEQLSRISVKPVTLAAAGLLAFTLAPASAQEGPREWSTSGLNNDVAITDCRDCGDNIGVMLRCQGAGRPAEVTVHWSAVEKGRDGAVLPIVFRIDRRNFTYQAKTVEFGQIGFTPQFELRANDPLVEALQAGRKVRVKFSGQSTDISLRGSRTAFKVFNAHCGWSRAAAQGVAPAGQPARQQAGATGGAQGQTQRQMPTVTLTNALGGQVDIYYLDAGGQPQFLNSLQPGQSVAGPFQPGAKLVFGVSGQQVAEYITGPNANQVFTIGRQGSGAGHQASAQAGAQEPVQAQAAASMPSQNQNTVGPIWQFYRDEQGGGTLIFGVPETDNTILVSTCRAGTGTASTEFFAGPPAGNPGQPVTVLAATQTGRQTVSATVNTQGRPVSASGPRGPLWTALLQPGEISLAINNQPAGKVTSISRSVAAGQFFTSCGWQ